MSTPSPGQQNRSHLHLVPVAERRHESDTPPTAPTRPALRVIASPAATEGEGRATRKAVLVCVARLYGPIVTMITVLAAACWAWQPTWWSAPVWGMLAPYHLALLLFAVVLVTTAGDYVVRLDRLERRLAQPAAPPSPAELGRAF